MMTEERSTKIGVGVLVLRCGHISYIVRINYFYENLLLYSQTYLRQTKYIVLINKEGLTKIITFMTPGAGVLVLGCGHISHLVKMHYFFKNLSSLLPVIDQTNYVYSIDDQGRVYQNCKFHDPRGWGSDVRAWPYKSLK